MRREVLEEISLCGSDFWHFATSWVKIIDRDTMRLVTIKPNFAQEKFLETTKEASKIYVLKARKEGLTTIVAIYFLWKALFRENHRVLVVSESDAGAKKIFAIYRRIYDNLPKFLKFRTTYDSKTCLEFFHRGGIECISAAAKGFRGDTVMSIHFSEFAHYNHIPETMAAAANSAPDSADIILETTANGMNDAHRLWYEDAGYKKLFISWTDDAGYVTDEVPKAIPQLFVDYAREHGITPEQLNWAVRTYYTKCVSNWNTWMQEYPLLPEHAFVTSGSRFFDVVFPHVKWNEGYMEWEAPQKYRAYIIGVDTASGSTSDGADYSAFHVLDVTDRDKEVPCVKTVASFYGRMPIIWFSQRVLQEARKWDALIVPERNNNGAAVIEHLVNHNWGHIYTQPKFADIKVPDPSKMGWWTGAESRPIMLARLQEWVARGWFAVTDPHMQAEINTFVYNGQGRPEHDTGKHDDMVFAAALAVMGFEQSYYVKEQKQRKRPEGLAERIAYKRQTGRRPQDEDEYHFEEVEDDLWGDMGGDEEDEDLPSAVQID